MEFISSIISEIQMEQWLILICIILVAGVIFKKLLKYAIVVAALIFLLYIVFPKYQEIIFEFFQNR